MLKDADFLLQVQTSIHSVAMRVITFKLRVHRTLSIWHSICLLVLLADKRRSIPIHQTDRLRLSGFNSFYRLGRICFIADRLSDISADQHSFSV